MRARGFVARGRRGHWASTCRCGRLKGGFEVAMPESNPYQLSIFDDRPSEIDLTRLRTHVAGHRRQAAMEAMATLGRYPALAEELDDYRRLLEPLQWNLTGPDLRAQAEQQQQQLECPLPALARRRLGSDRWEAYLSGLWMAFARRLPRLPFEPDAPHLHVSLAYERAGAWTECVSSIEAEPGWNRHPSLVARLAKALNRNGQLERARDTWCRLCWDHPETAENQLSEAPQDPILVFRWEEFVRLAYALPVQHFPSWLLLTDPFQARIPMPTNAPLDRYRCAYHALHQLLREDRIDHRRALRDQEPALLHWYLNRDQLG